MNSTDEAITRAYQQLNTALTPPPDAPARVARRMAGRRRRRRAGIAVAAAVVAAVASVAGIAVVGDTDGDPVAIDPTQTAGPLTLTRPDGSTYIFHDIKISCGPADSEPGRPPAVRAMSPQLMQGDGLLEPFVYFEGIVDDLQIGHTYELAASEKGPSDPRPFVLFVADASPDGNGNEVSSDEPGTAGTLRVLEASCHPTPTLRLQVDATLGSEVEQGTQNLEGSVN
jgi:hypothetical protein